MKRKKKGCKRRALMPVYSNPWPYADKLPKMREDMKLTKEELGELECRLDYGIKCDAQAMAGPGKNEELYRIFGEQIGKEPSFMRQWVRLYAITNKNLIKNIKGVKDGCKGDVLALFVLSIITRVHFVHLKWHNYWKSLKEIYNTHLEYMQRCNIDLSYLGQGTFIKLKLRTALVSYKLFGVDHPVKLEEKNPVVIGTLTSEEDATLDILLEQTSQP